MKTLTILISCAALSGCVIGSSNEVKRAEKLLQNFECKNLETTEIPHSSINSFHQQSLATSKAKATSYVEQFKSGDATFKMPLDEAVQQQLQRYKAACQALGGITPELK